LNEKHLLKKLMQNKIPESIIKRSKQAYRAPIKNAFLQKKPPDYIKEKLTPESFSRAGIFDYNSISDLLIKIEKAGSSSEVEDMVLASVISSHLLYDQFIEGHHEESRSGKLKNMKIIDQL